MAYDNSPNNPIVQRIRATIRGLQQTNQRSVTPLDPSQEQINDSVRTLARSRVSSILRQLRSSSGYSYEELSELSGLPKQLLFDVEFKEQRLTLEQLRLLADCYKTDVNDILGIDIE